MREIKFKAKKIINGEWVYGDLVINTETGTYRIFSNFANVIHGDITDNGLHYCSGQLNEVYPETVCQYTGMKDKKGKKVYEGDIVRFCDDSPYCSDYTIKYDDERLIWIADGVGDFMEDLWELGEDYVKVIDNIHDKARQKQALIDTMRGDEEIGLYNEEK